MGFPDIQYTNPLIQHSEDDAQRRRRESFNELSLEERSRVGIDTFVALGFSYIGHGKVRCSCCWFEFNPLEGSRDPVMDHGLSNPYCRHLSDYLQNGGNGDVLMAIQNQAKKNAMACFDICRLIYYSGNDGYLL